jgi:hypothetical protein
VNRLPRRFVPELASPWRARLALGLVERYGQRDLTKLSDDEFAKLRRRLHRIIAEEAEPFATEELELLPLRSTARVENLLGEVRGERARRSGVVVTIGGQRFVRAWWREPSAAKALLETGRLPPLRLPPLRSLPRPGRARRLVVRVARRQRLALSRKDDEPPSSRALARPEVVLRAETAR